MSEFASIREAAEVEAVKKIAVLEHLSQQIADILSEMNGQKCRIQMDLALGFIFIKPT